MAKHYNNSHTWQDISTAVIKMLPRLPTFIAVNIAIKRAKHDQIGSTGLFLQHAAQRFPERIFLRFAERTYTYAEFNGWVNQIAHTLQARGLQKGQCVALMLKNSPEQLACAFAVNKLGAVAGMVNYKQRDAVLGHSFSVLQPAMVIIAEEFAEAVNSAQPSLREVSEDSVPQCFVMGGSAQGYANLAELCTSASKDNPPQTAHIRLGENCFYVFTSGTTGLPKAAAMTHLRWYKAGLGFGRMALGLGKNDVQYCCLPFYHNTALSIALSSVVLTGSGLAIAERFSASQFWPDIHHHQATCFTYIGELCRYLLNQPETSLEKTHNVRAVVGNGLRAEIWDAFQQRFGISRICELYGASEGNIGFVNAFNLKRTVGFSPMKFTVVEFDVDNEQPVMNQRGHLQSVGKGDIGLLLAEVSNKAPFDGYTNQAASEAKLMRNVFKQGDCWFNTGDIVQQQGFRHIAFIDRVGDTFRWKAENVATTEVEAQIHSIADVIEAVVYGVEVPNADGRAGMVSLILNQDKPFNPQLFYENLRKRLPDYAVPLFVRLRKLAAYHETTGTFKIKKTELKQQGYKPEGDNDTVFVLLDRSLGYQPLNPQILAEIEGGQRRF